MPFEKGNPGRPKGSKNKRHTIFESLDQIQTENGDPVDVIKLFFNDMMQLPAMQRAEMWLKFMEYIYAKQKNVEVNAEMGIKIVVEDFLKKEEG
jgi:hypothetical protein